MSETQADSDKRCRTCLEPNANQVFLHNKVAVDGEEVMLSEIVFSCTGLHVNSKDHKPQSICFNCSLLARTLYQFQAICIQSDFKLQKEIENCVDKYFQEDPPNSSNNTKTETVKPNKPDTVPSGEQLYKLNGDPTEKSALESDQSDSGTESKTHKCNLCSKTYNHKRTLNKHVRQFHRRLNSFTNDIKLCTCKLCGMPFHELRIFMDHLKQHATGETIPTFEIFMKTEAIDSLLKNMEEFDKFEGVDAHVLQSVARLSRDIIDINIDDETDSILHAVAGPGEMEVILKGRLRRTHACTECDARFDSNVLMKKHINSEHGELSCLVCGAIYFEEKDLARHEANHCKDDVEKRHVCEHCGSSFLKPVYLQIHMRKHSGDKPYKCTECDARFALPSTLSYHKKKHSEAKEYVCDVCGMSFKFGSSLRTHVTVIHSNEATVKCTVCPQMFYTTSLMSAHHKAVHLSKKVFSCTECEKTFSRKPTLELHMKVHTGERYVCKICDKRFNAPSVLRFHLKTQHKKLL